MGTKNKNLELIIKRMLRTNLAKRIFISILSLFCAFFICAIVIRISGLSPFITYWKIGKSSFGSFHNFLEIFVMATPLILTGLSVAIAFKAGFWNIGAEGQLYFGASFAMLLATTRLGVAPVMHIALIILVGSIAGGIFALLPAFLKVKFKLDEVVITLLLNFIVIYILGALLDGPWRDPVTNWPHSPMIVNSALLPRLVKYSRFHVGVPIAFIVALVLYYVEQNTKWGYERKIVGLGFQSARGLGINLRNVIYKSAFISGSLAGLAGSIQLCGINLNLSKDLSNNFGYIGIAVAAMSALNPLGVILVALLFGMIRNGILSVASGLSLPTFFVDIFAGMCLLCVITGNFIIDKLKRRNSAFKKIEIQ